MKVLFIGGTGNISSAVTTLAIKSGIELWHLNRGVSKPTGSRSERSEETQETKEPQNSDGNHQNGAGVKTLVCDIQNEALAAQILDEHNWDCVVNWIAFTPADVERDMRLFSGKTRQYIFISSASVYQSPLQNPFITEQTPLENPFWEYSRDKIACETLLMNAYKESGFPAVIVRPSHTYSRIIPAAIGGGSDYTTVSRIKRGLPIVVHGDGTSLWVLTHAEDFARGFVGLIGLAKSIGEAFHITSDEVLTWNQIHETIAAALGIKAQIVHVTSDKICQLKSRYIGSLLGDKSTSVIFDNTKIKTFVPSFQAQIPFAEGIKSTLAWFEADPARQQVNPDTEQFIETLIAEQ